MATDGHILLCVLWDHVNVKVPCLLFNHSTWIDAISQYLTNKAADVRVVCQSLGY